MRRSKALLYITYVQAASKQVRSHARDNLFSALQGPPGAPGAEGRQGEKGAKVRRDLKALEGH